MTRYIDRDALAAKLDALATGEDRCALTVYESNKVGRRHEARVEAETSARTYRHAARLVREAPTVTPSPDLAARGMVERLVGVLDLCDAGDLSPAWRRDRDAALTEARSYLNATKGGTDATG